MPPAPPAPSRHPTHATPTGSAAIAHALITSRAYLAQLVGRLSLRSAATGHQKAFLVEGAHDAERVVDAALVLVQGHLVAASARGVRAGAGVSG